MASILSVSGVVQVSWHVMDCVLCFWRTNDDFFLVLNYRIVPERLCFPFLFTTNLMQEMLDLAEFQSRILEKEP